MLEFISAGGLGEAASMAPASAGGEPLLAQGVRMRDALLAELGALPALEISVADAGLSPLPERRSIRAPGAPVHRVSTTGVGDLAAWLRTRQAAFDLVWVIAPETGDCLLTLCEAVAPARWIGSGADAIRLATSKTRTRERLAAHGIPTPQAWAPGLPASAQPGRWVLKPDDGAGSEHTCVFADFTTARAALAAAAAPDCLGEARADTGPTPRWTLEAWVEGEALSLSLLCAAGGVEVLSVNRQRLNLAADGQLGYAGVDTGVEPVTPALRDLAERCAAAVPGLAGFVGLDLVRQPDGQLCVIEINPRLTCAYAGLATPPPVTTRPRSPCARQGTLAAAIIAAHDAAFSSQATGTADAPSAHA
jgi:predicted ATP-grasp superfamily ATP-dependent carboligase